MADDPARLHSFTRDGLTFEVDDAGPMGGETVVLLHGFPTDRTSWHRVAPLLHDAGLRTLAPDQRGYSAGARPPGRAAYRLEELLADVLALLDAAGVQRAHVVGHDWGGAVAWLLAANHPDRVASVTVLSTAHPAALSRALRSDRGQQLKSWYISAFQVPWVPERVFAALFASTVVRSGMPLEDARRYAAHLARADALTGPIGWYRATASSHVRAHRVSVPATLVWGSGDSFLGRTAAELTREHVTGPYTFVELDDNHWLPERRPQECAAAVIARVRDADDVDAGKNAARG
ncbi:pimeloyl-ACP methyl ester carboxylesterase [Humibacillus xanthopallidus]|uniref:Pimeloyl-ACP methyl ester carboxylesterase n=1 Tax=Humibacillus xanthopallidus TaxID=412689 RepID=A0A543PPX7_9MICO|nr:alpha/beta fold hydrolase [Humibacillus xanthopallidus]TQN46126.1 pimeloyl-ACP methyl ester carboxylesterase [Humibacillus xanthopallidus]